MAVSLKPLSKQTVVLTGATSGIGLATAWMLSRRGAQLVLAARSEDNLKELVRQIETEGGTAIYCVTDVGKKDEVERLSKAAIDKFGGFDTWINDAGVGLFGRIEQVSDEDNRKIFETNFWGIVNGSLTALKHLKQNGGALINLGSIGSDIGIPLQGMYSATKHAIKGFTDALRIELQEEGAPVSLTLIKPAAIATQIAQHSRNYLDQEPRLPPPVYNPEEVAYAICHAAETQTRDVYVGGAGRLMVAMQHFVPSAADWMGKMLMKSSVQPKAGIQHDDNFDKAGKLSRQVGDGVGTVLPYSAYTRAALHPVVSGLVLAGIGTALACAFTKSNQSKAVHYRNKAQKFAKRAQAKIECQSKPWFKKAKAQVEPLRARAEQKAQPYMEQAKSYAEQAKPYLQQAKPYLQQAKDKLHKLYS